MTSSGVSDRARSTFTYPQQILAQSPLHYWRLTSTADLGSGAATLTNVNSVPFSGRPTLVTESNGGGSASFSAAASPGHLKHAGAMDGLTSFTYLAAIQPDKLLTKHILLNVKQAAATGNDLLGIELVDNGAGGLTPRVYRWGGSALWVVRGAQGVVFPTGAVGHLAIVFNASDGSIKGYIDGVDVSGLTTTAGSQPASWPAIGSSSTVFIGAYQDGVSAPFDGLMAEVAIIPSVLSGSVIADLHGSSRKVTQAVYLAAFDAGSLTGTGSIDPAAQVTTHPAVGLTTTHDSAPAHGSISASGGVWNFDHSGAVDSSDSFTGHISKGGVDSSTQTVSLTWATTAQVLPLVPDMSFLASDGTIPGGTVRYAKVGGSGVGGSTEEAAGDLQTTINATKAGETVLALGGNYDLPNGLTFPNNGSSGSPITLMAKPGNTVVIDKGLAFAAYRTPSPGLGTRWELFDVSKKIWRSVAATFGSTVRPLGGVWFEGGWPHYILPCDSLPHLQAPLGTANIWTNYGGPCALVHTDGRIYVRWQIPDPNKMSFHNKWPTDGRMDYMPGWVSKSGGTAGQLHFPATEDPRDYSIYLVQAPGGGGGGVGFTLTNRSWITIGSGINSFGHEIGVKMAGASNIRFDRGTHINQRFHWDFSGTACSNITVNRVRTSHGCIKHQPLVNWKFGGPLESSYRGGTFAFDGHDNQNLANNVTMQDCTFHGWHDFQLGGGTNWVIKQCTFVQVMDDGWQLYPTVAQGMVVHHCYFLDSPLGGLENDAGSNTLNTQAIYFSHNIFDHRCPRIVDTGTSPQSEPYLAAFNAPHYNAGVRCPYKWYNNTVIWSPDANGKKGPWLTHCEGDESATSPFHENFNNIVMVLDYQRYVGNAPSGGAWLGQCSSVCRRMITTGANEAHDYCILWRDVPNPETHFFQEIIHAALHGQSVSNGSPEDFNTLTAWKASGKFKESKGVYLPGFHNSSYQVNPQIPSAVPSVPDFATRRNYRPAVSQASSGYSSSKANSPAGEAFSGWSANAPKWDSWIGALNPNGTDMPVGVQNP